MFFICLFITIALTVALTNDYGSFGVAIARLSGFSALFVSVFYVEKWFFGKIQFGLWLKIAGVLVVSAILSAIVQKLIISNLSISWLTFIFSTVCGGIVYCLLVGIMGFVSDDEKLLVRRILRR
jgi:hypothetical protein